MRKGSDRLYVDRMVTGRGSAHGLFVPIPRAAPPADRRSASGLVLPGISSTAWMLGLAPVPEGHAWLDNLVRVYVIAREYLGPFEAACGRDFDRDAWIRVVLNLYPAEEFLCQLAALNHAATSDGLTLDAQQRYLDDMVPDAAQALRHALAGGVDGQRRGFLARQLVLRAMRLVLVPPESAAGWDLDRALQDRLDGISAPAAAVLLVHLVGDALHQERSENEPRFCGTSEQLAMEMIANNLFYDRDDNGDLLARYRMLWLDYGPRLKRFTPRQPPADMLREAAGVELDEMITLAFAYWACLQARGHDDPIQIQAMVSPEMTISREHVETFLGLFASTPASLADELRQYPQPWQMMPVQSRPLLRLGNEVVVLDERYLVERVTRGLFWLVHDYEKEHYGERARSNWTQVWSEMVETRVEDQLRQMAPSLVGGGRAFFTEEDLQAAFPGKKNCDAGIDYGSDVVLAEVVSGTVKVTTRELADVSSFTADTERIVLGKARQLYETAANLQRRPSRPPRRSAVRPGGSSPPWSSAVSSRSTR